MSSGNQSRSYDDQIDVGTHDHLPTGRAPGRSGLVRLAVAGAATAVLAFGAACSADSPDEAAAPADTSPEALAAVNGERLARSMGCAGCHGQDFDGAAGPPLVGLAGSEVALVDGTTVADDDYLTRAIADPGAEVVEGYSLRMPANSLSDAEIADIVAFINTLADDADPARTLAGIVRDPAPAVDATTLPSLTGEGDEGNEVVFRAEPGGLKAIYFGYTNCPDVCPTTMADWTVALRRLPEVVASQIDTVMVTVDPERDSEVLSGYVQSFVPDAVAAGTFDADRLARAAEPFGASYEVTTNSDGEIEVAHSGFLYLVGDDGTLLVAWPFGTSSQEMAADVEQLFAAQAAS